MLDLGAIGKGYAVARAAGLLREAGVTNALIHGGTSTAFALGRDAGGAPWKIAVKSPSPDPAAPPLAVVELENEALSVSAVWGRSFQAGGRTYGHVIDPRTGERPFAALLENWYVRGCVFWGLMAGRVPLNSRRGRPAGWVKSLFEDFLFCG